MNILTAENITKAYTERVLLENVSFSLSDGEKVGVVGVNGMGKSTLLKIIAGAEEPDDGQVIKGGNIKIGYLPQNPVFEENDTVLTAVVRNISESSDDMSAVSEAKAMLQKLDIKEYDQKITELSGGQKKRVALINILLQPVDVLILDEPTNHLDSRMSEWLENHLINFRGSIIMVTHDRYFLDRIATRIVEVDNGSLYSYPGSYSKYVELRQERLDIAKASERKRQSILRTELKWLARGARARSTKQKAHIQRIEDMQNVKPIEDDAELVMNSVSQRMGKKTIEISNISKSFGDKRLIDDFTYFFLKNDRIGIVGPNGCGKSTLLKIITGVLKPDSGSIEMGSTVSVGYFSQENEYMDESQLAIQYIRDVAEYINTPDGKLSASALMERFLFDGTRQWTRIEKLSGGEKRRLYLLHVLIGAPNVLILDEPTNDIDIRTLTILEDYLDSFQGIVITVSHDRYFLDRIARRIFAYEPGGRIRQFEGGYSEYYELMKDSFNDESGKKTEKKPKGYRPPREKKLKFTYAEQKEFETIDEVIASLEERIAQIDDLMVKNASDYPKLAELTKEKEEKESLLDEKTERWVYLNELAEKINEQ